ncbi:fungal-specific transcription factor domain-containing protein [Ustulina deusta]|nr:fungal-specific transcription factor domain-containing protein [Ustulina deusta]
MSEAAAESGQSRRKHVTTACLSCRESKVKCDAEVPSCSNCKHKGKECRYQTGDDKRKLSLRVAIELLSKRATQLCDFIHANGLQPPAMEQDSEAALTKIMDGLKLSHLLPCNRTALSPPPPPPPVSTDMDVHTFEPQLVENLPLPSPPDLQSPVYETPSGQLPYSPRNVGMVSKNKHTQNTLFSRPLGPELLIDSDFSLSDQIDPALPDWNWSELTSITSNIHQFHTTTEMDALIEGRPGVSNALGHPDTDQGASPCSHSNSSPADSEDTRRLLSLLSDRMGSLQIESPGQVRFYGPTSNFNLIDMPAPDNLTVHRTVRSDGQDYIDRLGIGAAVPSEIEEHLENLYFSWQDPALHVVNRSVYEEAKDRWKDEEDTPFFSLALLNAICALGAAFESRYHPTFITFPRSLADFFADRAKVLLDIELDSPCIATVQAMVVLSGHDIGCKRDARGWLYSGMALRLAFDLSLHIDLSPYVARGLLNHEEANLRQTIFWAACTADRIWSYLLGRPSPRSMKNLAAPRPSADLNLQGGSEWIPYVTPRSLEACSPVVGHVDITSMQRALLLDIIAPLSEAVYEGFGTSYSGLEEMYKTVAVDLVKWKADLNTSLQIDTKEDRPYLPHVILLHMQYHQIMLYAHRPWMSRSYTQSNLFFTDARRQCIDSAVAIAELLKIYESQYAFRRINVQAVGMTCSAALLLIFAVVTGYQGPDGKQLKPYLSICFRAMEQFSLAWENAKRSLNFLILVRRKWETGSRAASFYRPPSSNKLPVDFRGRKRARTSSTTSNIRPNISMPQLVPVSSAPWSQC